MRLLSLNFLAQILLASSEVEEDAQKILDYPYFAELMAWWNIKWEPVKVKTEDGFTLVTFHLLGRRGKHHRDPDPSLNPIMMMNGLECDATSWFGLGDKSIPPMPIRFLDEGFDVWLANNRATKYC